MTPSTLERAREFAGGSARQAAAQATEGGADLDAFIGRERERYAAQLERYARTLAARDQSGLGLNFPLVTGWRDWRHRD